MEPPSGCRYKRAIRQSLNKRLGRSALNRELSTLICEFSHAGPVKAGSYLSRASGFFVVRRVLSPHWCEGFFCPAMTEYVTSIHGIPFVMRAPNAARRTDTCKKRIFSPFTNPCIRRRQQVFTLEGNEQVPNYHAVLV